MKRADNNFSCIDFTKLNTGDAVFVKGKNDVLSLITRFLSNSNFVHAAILIELRGLWFVIETTKKSQHAYQLVPVTWWLTRHRNDEIYVGKMPAQNSINATKVKNILMDAMESIRPYKLSWLILIYFLQVWLGFFRPNLNKLFNNSKPLICSTLVQEAWERAGVMETTNYMTPGCLINYLGGEKSLYLLSDSQNNTPCTHSTEEPELDAITI